MTCSFPTEIAFNSETGVLSPTTGQNRKHLSQLKSVFHDIDACEQLIETHSDPLVYEVREYRQDDSDLFFGTTTMQPGKVGNEYYMTRGHFHFRRDMGEFYCTQSGTGILMLQNRDGRCETVDMRVGSCVFIPPDWAHRSINTGPSKLVFTWVCNIAAGQDYDALAERGMRLMAVEKAGDFALVPNPNFR